jgi:hypothetical protein
MHRDIPVRVARASSGEALPLVQTASPTACAGFSAALVVDFQKDEHYRLWFGPTDAAEVELFIEHLGTFADEAWALRCP